MEILCMDLRELVECISYTRLLILMLILRHSSTPRFSQDIAAPDSQMSLQVPPSKGGSTRSPPNAPPYPRAHPSIPLPRRLRARTPTHTPLIMTPHPQPLLRPQLQLPLQLRARLLPVDEIAESAPHAPFAAVQPAARFSEIGDGGEFAIDGARGVPAAVEGVAGLLGRVFVFEAGVDVADEVWVCG